MEPGPLCGLTAEGCCNTSTYDVANIVVSGSPWRAAHVVSAFCVKSMSRANLFFRTEPGGVRPGGFLVNQYPAHKQHDFQCKSARRQVPLIQRMLLIEVNAEWSTEGSLSS